MRSSSMKLSSLFWLLGACCSCLVNAKTLCDEHFRTDHIEIRFVPPTSEIPQSFMVTYGAQNSEARVTRVADGGAWRGSITNSGVIGNQDKVGLRLSLTRHKATLYRWFNQPMEGMCYAVYTFNVKQTAWILEVDAKPESPFWYRKSGTADWIFRQPGSEESAWNLIPPLGMGMKESLDIQVWEAAGVEPTYLFTLKEVDPSTVGTMDFNRDKIARQIMRDRSAVINNPLNLQTSGIRPDDPYLKQVKLSRNLLGEEALKKIIEDKLHLKTLKLKDASEVSP
jgi:hypothetical protein